MSDMVCERCSRVVFSLYLDQEAKQLVCEECYLEECYDWDEEAGAA